MIKLKKILLVSVASVFLSACGGGGGGGSSTPTPPAPVNIAPVASAGVDQTVDEQSAVNLDASGSTDADGTIQSYAWTQTSGTPTVTLSNANSVTATFDAPSISVTSVLGFSVLVTDNDGDSSSSIVTITVNPVAGLNDAPLADAGPAQSVASGDMVTLDGSLSTDNDGTIASYAWAQLSGTPTVTLAAEDTANATFTAPTVTANTVLSFTVTATDNEGATADDFVEITVTPASSAVTISGKATYDNVPHNIGTNGLNYLATTKDPIRGAVVELIQGASTIAQSDVTDLNGNYSFDVNPNSGNYFIRIKSRALRVDTASWDAKVVDNTTLDPVTSQQTIYALDGSTFTVTTAAVNRPTMNAASGWGGTSYTGTRAGAPFHILDRIMDGHLKLLTADPAITFPALEINWSSNNSSTGSGSLADLRTGAIGTSFYSSGQTNEFSGPQIFILGAENSDTDEYDGHVIVHEWGHYFENNLSRSDSIGGAHSAGDRLDMRLAFGEGFGNAWSGIITDDSFYRDSLNTSQSQGFSIDVESNSNTNMGWYNEGSVQSILYDLYDTTNDGADSISLGFKPIYDVLVGPQKTTQSLTSIFSFITFFKSNNPASVAEIDALLTAQSINGTDIWGSGETNDAGAVPSAKVLPIYTELTVGGAAKQLCSIDDYDSPGISSNLTEDSGNKLSVFRFVRFTLASAGSYRFTISANSTKADPRMDVYVNVVTNPGQFFTIDDAADGVAEDKTLNLAAGDYVAEVFEYDNTPYANSLIATDSSDECFDVQIQTAP